MQCTTRIRHRDRILLYTAALALAVGATTALAGNAASAAPGAAPTAGPAAAQAASAVVDNGGTTLSRTAPPRTPARSA